jgi:hypothetical protein
MVPASSFSTAIESVGPRLNVVIARGEVDLVNAEDFEDELLAALGRGRSVDLDCRPDGSHVHRLERRQRFGARTRRFDSREDAVLALESA